MLSKSSSLRKNVLSVNASADVMLSRNRFELGMIESRYLELSNSRKLSKSAFDWFR